MLPVERDPLYPQLTRALEYERKRLEPQGMYQGPHLFERSVLSVTLMMIIVLITLYCLPAALQYFHF